MKSLKTIINESASSKSDISTFVSVLKDMFSWDSLDSKGKEIVRDMFSDSDSRGTIQPQLLAFAGSTPINGMTIKMHIRMVEEL